MKCLILLIVALSLAPFLFGQSQTCDSFNYYPAYTWNNVPSGYVEHSTGDHALQFMDIKGQCIYSSINQKYCAISTQTAMTASGVEEKGALTTLIREHAIAASAQGGAASSNGPQIQSGATGAVAATSCLIVLGCNVTISFSASASGVGVTASFSNTNLGYTYQQRTRLPVGKFQTRFMPEAALRRRGAMAGTRPPARANRYANRHRADVPPTILGTRVRAVVSTRAVQSSSTRPARAFI